MMIVAEPGTEARLRDLNATTQIPDPLRENESRKLSDPDPCAEAESDPG